MTSWFEEVSQIGAVHSSGKKNTDIFVFGVELIKLLADIIVNVLGCLDINLVIFSYRLKILMSQAIVKIFPFFPDVSE
jgi:hypothetical protein